MANVREFINHIAPIICKEADKRGYKIKSTVIAQAIIEGASGTSKLAKNYHNHFGMKCGSSWKGKAVNLSTKEEYKPGTLTSIKAYFRAYDTDEEGIAGYYDFIEKNKRYANLKDAKDYADYARMLKADGWATSSTYVNSLTSTVKKYDLVKYDGSEIVSHPMIRKGAKGDVVKLAQTLLNAHGFYLKVDGIFGMLTESAVLEYQALNNLKADGIIGPKTWAALTL